MTFRGKNGSRQPGEEAVTVIPVGDWWFRSGRSQNDGKRKETFQRKSSKFAEQR